MPLSKTIKSPSKMSMTEAQLAEWEACRDLDAELVESVRQMKRGEGTVVPSPVIAARQNCGLSQAQFALLLDLSAPVRDEAHYAELLAFVEECFERFGAQDSHPIFSVVAIVAQRIKAYEDRFHPWPDASTGGEPD